MKYVAYGSNLNVEQMSYRCPNATVLYKGIVKDYTLTFRGSKTGAYATIIPKKGDYVPVVVWEIDDDDEKALDRYEGFPTFYYKKVVRVSLSRKRNINAMAYVMFDKAVEGIPTAAYVRTCVQGYRDNDLDVLKFAEFVNTTLDYVRERDGVCAPYVLQTCQ